MFYRVLLLILLRETILLSKIVGVRMEQNQGDKNQNFSELYYLRVVI